MTVARVVRGALAEGRTRLFEDEGLEVLGALGFEPPLHRVVAGADAVSAALLEPFPGDRAVVKLRSADVAHRTEVGGVAIVPREPAAVAEAMRDMAERSPDASARFLIAEYVPHRHEPGGELLLDVRWTAEFGPVATLAIGGVSAEALALALAPEERLAAFAVGVTAESVSAVLERKRFAPLITGALRGRSADPEVGDVAYAITRLLDSAAALMPDVIAEIEINPLVFRSGRPVPLDALVTLGPRAVSWIGAVREPPPLPTPLELEPLPAWRRAGIRALLEPKSVAILGVSSRLNPGRVILRNLLASGFPSSRVRIVKPGCVEVDGCACVPDIDALDPPADLLVIAVAAAPASEALQATVRGGRARAVILIPGGLGEREGSEEHAAALERLLVSIRADSGADGLVRPAAPEPWRPVVNGGNCLGIRSLPGRCDTLFIPGHKLRFPSVPAQPVALVSQSGAFAIARASGLPWLNPRYLITLGNQVDLTLGEYLEHLADDLEVRVFACYVEGFRPLDGRRFLEATQRITAQGRAVILYRAGRSAEGADAMASHTASIAGDYAVTRELAEQAGALVADTIDEFDDLLALAVRLDGTRLGGLRLGAMSNAGFECVAMADRIGPFALADFTAPTRAALAALLERSGLAEIVTVRNPLDVTPITEDESFAEAARLVLADAAVNVAAIGCVPLTPALRTLPGDGTGAEGISREESVVRRLVALMLVSEKAWIAVVDSGPAYDPMVRALSAAGIAVFRAADRGLRAFGRYCEWRLLCRTSAAMPGA